MTVFHKITWDHLVQLENGGHDKFLPSLGNDDVRYMVDNIRSSFTEGKLFQPEAHLAKQNENAPSMMAPKGQEVLTEEEEKHLSWSWAAPKALRIISAANARADAAERKLASLESNNGL
jgi:hypothetical protein